MRNVCRSMVSKVVVSVVFAVVGTAVAQWDLVPPNWVHRVHPTNDLWYDLYIPYPDSLEAGKTYPMVLALHGCCRANDDDPGEVVVGVDNIYRQWHNYGSNTQTEPTWIVAPGSMNNWDTKRDRIFEILDDLIVEFPIDTQRIIITGFSRGGRGSFTFANARPHFFSAIIPAAAALSDANDFVVDNIKGIPTFGGVCAGDDWCDNHELTVSPVRAANGDTRGNYRWVRGVNPIFERWDSTCHGESMGYLYGTNVVGMTPVSFGLSRVNDGNVYPNVRFTSHDHNDTIGAGLVRFAVDARDDGQITKVEFLREQVGRNDRQVVATVTEAPWEADIWISGERMPIFRIDGSVNIWARAYDNGSSLGYAMDKYSTDAVHLYTDGPALGTVQRTVGAAHRAGITFEQIPTAVRVLTSREEPMVVCVLRLDGTAVWATRREGAGAVEVAYERLASGTYLLEVVQAGAFHSHRFVTHGTGY